jgi:hypothetical protein
MKPLEDIPPPKIRRSGTTHPHLPYLFITSLITTSTGPSVTMVSVNTTKNKKMEKPRNPVEKTDTRRIIAAVENNTPPNSTKSSELDA